MKTIIAGSRTISTYDSVLKAIASCPFRDNITSVFSGMAPGPDIFGFRWANERKIPVVKYPAEWKKYGKQAGVIRNIEMASFSEAAIVLWDMRSRGTSHLLHYMKKMDPPSVVHLVHVDTNREQTIVEYGRKESDY